MKFTAKQIAVQLEGTVDGDPTAEVYQLSKIEDAIKEIDKTKRQLQKTKDALIYSVNNLRLVKYKTKQTIQEQK